MLDNCVLSYHVQLGPLIDSYMQALGKTRTCISIQFHRLGFHPAAGQLFQHSRQRCLRSKNSLDWPANGIMTCRNVPDIQDLIERNSTLLQHFIRTQPFRWLTEQVSRWLRTRGKILRPSTARFTCIGTPERSLSDSHSIWDSTRSTTHNRRSSSRRRKKTCQIHDSSAQTR